jgi:dolichyl-phosphate beta-glucosyltransferase
MRLSVVIPAFNEIDRLPATLAAIAAHIVSRPHWSPAEVVVVDDGSGDGTDRAAASFVPTPGLDLVLLQHPTNCGKGAAVRTGFAASRGAQVLLCDADEATPIDELERLAASADGGSVVIGSRAVDRTLISVRQPLRRDLLGRLFNLATRLGGLAREHDTQCGFKLFPGDLARALAGAQRLNGFAYDVELLVLARRWGFSVREVAVSWRHVSGSRITPLRHGPEMLRDLVRLWWWKSRQALPPRPDTLRDRRAARATE